MSKAEEIQQRMDAVRHDIDEDVDGLVEEAKSLIDWKDYVRAHPWAALGVAAAVGYVMIPKRAEIVQADPELVAKMMNSGKIVMAPNASVKQSKPWAGALLTSLLSVVVRSAAGQVGNQVAARFAETTERPAN